MSRKRKSVECFCEECDGKELSHAQWYRHKKKKLHINNLESPTNADHSIETVDEEYESLIDYTNYKKRLPI